MRPRVESPDFFTSQCMTPNRATNLDYEDQSEIYEEVACVASNPKDFEFPQFVLQKTNKGKKIISDKNLTAKMFCPIKS